MRNRTIGGITVSAIGLGGMPMSIEGRPGEGRSIATIHAALDAGVTLIDTADAYHMRAGETGHNEQQNQFSPAFRSSEDELRYCAELGVAFLPWSPLGGIARAGQLGSRHAAIQQVADAYGVSPQQITLAWMLAKASVVIPIPGASRPQSITDSANAADLTLTPAEFKTLDQS